MMDYAVDVLLHTELEETRIELEDTRKVRDEWCAEYVRVRDELDSVRADLEFHKKITLAW